MNIKTTTESIIDSLNHAINNHAWATLKRDGQEIRIFKKDLGHGVLIVRGEFEIAKFEIFEYSFLCQMVEQWVMASWHFTAIAFFQGFDAYKNCDNRSDNPYEGPKSMDEFYETLRQDSDYIIWDRGYSAAESLNTY